MKMTKKIIGFLDATHSHFCDVIEADSLKELKAPRYRIDSDWSLEVGIRHVLDACYLRNVEESEDIDTDLTKMTRAQAEFLLDHLSFEMFSTDPAYCKIGDDWAWTLNGAEWFSTLTDEEREIYFRYADDARLIVEAVRQIKIAAIIALNSASVRRSSFDLHEVQDLLCAFDEFLSSRAGFNMSNYSSSSSYQKDARKSRKDRERARAAFVALLRVHKQDLLNAINAAHFEDLFVVEASATSFKLVQKIAYPLRKFQHMCDLLRDIATRCSCDEALKALND